MIVKDSMNTTRHFQMRENKGKILYAICIAIIIALSNLITLSVYAPLPGDESGYIAQAAFLAGKNWSETTSQLAFYAFGEGLVANILFRFISDPIILYRSLLFLNTLLLCGTFVLIEKSVKLILNIGNDTFTLAISLLTVIIPSNILYSNQFLAENYITFIFIALVYLYIMLNKCPKTIYVILYIALSIYIIAIHQRMIGFGVLCISMLIILLWRRKINVRQVIIAVIILGILVFSYIYYKQYVKLNLWGNSVYGNKNDFSSLAPSILDRFTADNILVVLKNLVGKIWYITVSTCGFATIGIGVMTCKSIFQIRKIKKDDQYNILLFLTCTFWISIIVVTGLSSYPARIDHIFIGRYMDALLGPFFIYGIYWIYRHKDRKTYLYIIILALFLGNFVEKYAEEVVEQTDYVDKMSNTGLIAFLNDPFRNGDMINITLIYISIMVLIYIMILCNKKLIFFVLGTIFLLNIYAGNNLYLEYQKQDERGLREIVNLLDEEEDEATIAFLYKNIYACILQYMTPDTRFELIEIEELANCEHKYILLKDGQIKQENMPEQYSLIMENELCSLYKLRTN